MFFSCLSAFLCVSRAGLEEEISFALGAVPYARFMSLLLFVSEPWQLGKNVNSKAIGKVQYAMCALWIFAEIFAITVWNLFICAGFKTIALRKQL